MAVGDQGAVPDKPGMPMWLIIGGGAALALFLYLRSRNANAGATSSPLVPATVTDPNTGLPVDPLTGLPYVTNPQSAPTNDTWYNGALQWASTHGFSGSLSNQALYDYINGQLLSAQESNVIDKVLSGYGAPPDPLPFGGTPVLPAPTPTPVKPTITNPFGSRGWPQNISAVYNKLVAVPAGSTFSANGVPYYALSSNYGPRGNPAPYGPLYLAGDPARKAVLYNQTVYTFPEYAKYIVPPAKAA